MNTEERVELLKRAAFELSGLIASYNARVSHDLKLLAKYRVSQQVIEPDYMDMQTCHDLQALANELNKG